MTNNYMPKKPILFLFACVYCFACGQTASANDQPSKKIVTDKALTRFNPYNADFEKVLEAQEAVLKKLKVRHVHKERKQHVRKTEKIYEEAINLYHHKRSGPARKVLAKVEDEIADYRSTDTLAKVIDNRSIQKLKKQMHRLKEIRATKMEISLTEKATGLFQKAQYLGEDQNTMEVRKKLAKLVGTFHQMSQQVYVQQQLDKIAQEANDFDQKVFQLTQSKDYPAAKKKYEEFQQAMLNDLTRVKQIMSHQNNNSLGVMEPQQ